MAIKKGKLTFVKKGTPAKPGATKGVLKFEKKITPRKKKGTRYV